MNGVWQKFFPNDAFDYRFLDDTFNELHKADIRTSRLMLIFSVLAIVIAALGLFGLTTFTVERRTKEIGIRKVLGAPVHSIVGMLSREFLMLVSAGFIIAVPLSWWAMSRWLENFAYRIHISGWIFVAGAVVTLMIAFTAVGWKAINAATENPVKAIKSE
jgi:putative ABC transport system permease protein